MSRPQAGQPCRAALPGPTAKAARVARLCRAVRAIRAAGAAGVLSLALLAGAGDAREARAEDPLAGLWLMEDGYSLMAAGLIVPVFEVVAFDGQGGYQAGWWHAAQPYAVASRIRIEEALLAAETGEPSPLGEPDWTWPFPLYAIGDYAFDPAAGTLALEVMERRDVRRDRIDERPMFGETRTLQAERVGDDTLYLTGSTGQGLRYRRADPQALMDASAMVSTFVVPAVGNWRCALEAGRHWRQGTLPAIEGVDGDRFAAALDYLMAMVEEENRIFREVLAALPDGADSDPSALDQAVEAAQRRYMEEVRIPRMEPLMAVMDDMRAAMDAVGDDLALFVHLCPDSRRPQLADRCMMASDAEALLGAPVFGDIRKLPQPAAVADRLYRQCACLADTVLEDLSADQVRTVLMPYQDELGPAFDAAGATAVLAAAAQTCRQ